MYGDRDTCVCSLSTVSMQYVWVAHSQAKELIHKTKRYAKVLDFVQFGYVLLCMVSVQLVERVMIVDTFVLPMKECFIGFLLSFRDFGRPQPQKTSSGHS